MSEVKFVDTNIFLRYLTNDDPVKAQACLALFKQAEQGKVKLFATESVIAEIVYILASKRLYNLSRSAIRKRLIPLLTLSGLTIPHRPLHLRALELFEAHAVDYEDALAVAYMEQHSMTDIYSYDRDFDKFAQVQRLEP